MSFDKKKSIDLYRMMVRIRAFEEQCIQLSHKGLIGGSLHLYIGEEAIAAGSIDVLNADDYIASTHRGHGHCIAKEADMGRMFAELLGKETGYCKGRGGSMHIADVKLGMLGANGIVGAGIPIAVGAALAIKYRKGNQVVLCFFGDGATSTGAFHEGVNLGAAWRLPVIFICENNLYAITTPISKSCALRDVADRANGYGMPGVMVDGNDVLAVREAALKAVERARKGDGPTLIECKTYRWLGHHLGDDGKYRSPEEVQYWKDRDPIKTFSHRLLKEKIATEKGLKEIHGEVEKEIETAVKFAYDSPPANPERILEDVFYSIGNLSMGEKRI
ncbi:MAG: thiamine pyrophosphate-dependent dehydrogenase E1 component subunit alpha [Deltaproteobacteria bacterium]|nr:thiamine pyrophosphate-dependent dehydrogenase E1 component subunit alpha [Deltaproteobacteria bacterium]